MDMHRRQTISRLSELPGCDGNDDGIPVGGGNAPLGGMPGIMGGPPPGGLGKTGAPKGNGWPGMSACTRHKSMCEHRAESLQGIRHSASRLQIFRCKLAVSDASVQLSK